MTDYKEVSTTEHDQGQERRIAAFKATYVIWLLLGILEAALALRFVFKLIGVNAANTFAKFLYGVTGIFVKPFASLIKAPAANGSTLEISTLIAMAVYALIAWAIERITWVIFYRPRGPKSVTQTSVAEHTAPLGVSKTTTTQTPTNTSQTTVTTDRTNTQPPGSL
jgi:hypothetical protein